MQSGLKIFSKDGCTYCVKAKDFLTEKQIPFQTEKLIPDNTDYAQQRQDLIDRTGQKTFPWIFAGDKFIGGYTELLHAYNTFELHDTLSRMGIELESDF